jgi:pilus assembly protein CpaF
MFAIVVNEKGGEQKRLEFDKPEVTIGRVQGNDIILPKGNVSKRHSRIVLKDGKFIIVDLKSTNGTYVNGRKITSPLVVKGSDKIYIGDFILSIEEMAGAGASLADEVPPPPPRKTTASIPPPPPRRAPAPLDEDLPPAGDSADSDDEPETGRPARPTAPTPMAPSSLPPAPAPAPRPAMSQPATRQTLSADSRPASRADVPAMPRPNPAPAVAPRPAPAPAPAAVARPEPLRRPTQPPPPQRTAQPAVAPVADEKRAKIIEVMQKAAARLASGLPDLTEEGAAGRVERAAGEILEDLRGELPAGVDAEMMARDLAAEATAAGPLDELMGDEGVSEISVARFDRLYTDRGGALQAVARWFSSADAVIRAAERLLVRAGRGAEVDAARASGVLEARLENGWVLRAALPPLSARGASLSLRRPHRAAARLSELVGQGFLSQGMADFLELAVKGRRNVIVSGPAGSGRTTLLSAMARSAEAGKVVSVEEAEEIDLGDGPWTALIGSGGHARSALGLALRMRPDHLVVGDVRGPEAFDLIAAMAGGADGILCAVTAGSARDAAARLEAMARLAPEAPSGKALAEEIARGTHVVVQLGRSPEGEPRVVEIVDGPSDPIFTFKPEGGGRFAATGHVPAWAEGASPAMFRA